MLAYDVRYPLVLGTGMRRALRKRFSRREVRRMDRRARRDFRYWLGRAEDIGKHNPMAGNLYGAIFFLSYYTANPEAIPAADLPALMEAALTEGLIGRFLQRGDLNDPQAMARLERQLRARARWAERHRARYPGTWDFHFEEAHRDGVSYTFTRCPIVRFCRDNGMAELAPMFCALDYVLLGARGGRLLRKETLAEGGACCDFWIVGDRLEDPQ